MDQISNLIKISNKKKLYYFVIKNFIWFKNSSQLEKNFNICRKI